MNLTHSLTHSDRNLCKVTVKNYCLTQCLIGCAPESNESATVYVVNYVINKLEI